MQLTSRTKANKETFWIHFWWFTWFSQLCFLWLIFLVSKKSSRHHDTRSSGDGTVAIFDWLSPQATQRLANQTGWKPFRCPIIIEIDPMSHPIRARFDSRGECLLAFKLLLVQTETIAFLLTSCRSLEANFLNYFSMPHEIFEKMLAVAIHCSTTNKKISNKLENIT